MKKPEAPPDSAKPTGILQDDLELQARELKVGCWERSIGKLSSKAGLKGLVATKKKVGHSTTNRAGAQKGSVSSGIGNQSRGQWCFTAFWVKNAGLFFTTPPRSLLGQ